MQKRAARWFSILLVGVLVSARAEDGADASAQNESRKAFFENVKALCGKKFEGATEFPPDTEHPLAGRKLIISVEQCGEQEIRIPLQAGEDKSRTWILTLSPKGLLLKHDHRH
ncbi:MAG: hypothetical protein H0W20_12740, partial [Chthoniobacterales bacterium]|nr:hypothetical protein [Chthoniobacterales bacterium]